MKFKLFVIRHDMTESYYRKIERDINELLGDVGILRFVKQTAVGNSLYITIWYETGVGKKLTKLLREEEVL